MKRLLSILLPLALMVSCLGTDQAVNVSVNGLEDAVFDGFGTQIYSFTVVANGPWRIVKKELSWLEADPAEGDEGSTTVRLTAARNLTEGRRSGTLSVVGGLTTPSATFSQEVGYGIVLYGLESLKLDFDCRDFDAATFKVRSNTPWTITLSGLDWAEISPLSGGVGETIVTVLPSDNEGAARSGSIVLTPEQGETLNISVAQQKWRRPPFFQVTGTEKPIVFPGYDAQPVAIVVASNFPWTLQTEASWIEADVRESQGEEDGTTVHIRAADNDNVDRSATVTIASGNADLGSVSFTVRQKNSPTSPSLLAKWYLEDSYIREQHSNWLSSGNINSQEISSDDLETAVFQYIKNPGDTKSRSYIFSSTGGHYVARPAYEGDYLKISVPIDHLPAGTQIALRTAVHSSTSRSPRDYAVEYLDGSDWKACEGTSAVKFESNKNPIPIDATAVLSEAVEEGTVVFRIRVSSNVDISGAAPNTSSTMQITQRGLSGEEFTNYITVWQMPK